MHLPIKINILWLIDRTGSSLVKRSIDLQLMHELPLILHVMAKISAADPADKRVYTVLQIFRTDAHRYKDHLWKFSLQKYDYKKCYPAIHNNCQDQSVMQIML